MEPLKTPTAGTLALKGQSLWSNFDWKLDESENSQRGFAQVGRVVEEARYETAEYYSLENLDLLHCLVVLYLDH